MNGITGAAAQNPGTIPYTPAEAADLKATGFGFKEGGVDWDTWINNARTSDDPKTQAQLRELIDLAGGRTDNAAIKEAMARYGAMQQAASPNATAADKQAALRGMEDQLTTAMGRMDIKGKLTAPLDNAAKLLLNDPAYANTEWGQALSNVLGAGKNYASFQWGLAQGIWEGGKSLVTGVVDLAAKALQYGADNGILGQAGDALRGLTGKMPGWLEAVVPSAKRGEASTDALMAMGKGIGDYLSSKTPGDVAKDIGDAIGKAWDGLKADHAAARAKGPEAEAEWWGKTIGRVGFEIGATFIPVAGQAGKVSAGVRATDAAIDGARVLDKAADGVKVGDKVSDGVRGAGKADEVARLSQEGMESLLSRARRILGDLPLNSKSLDDLYQAGKLTMNEARELAKSVNWKDAQNQWIWPPNNGFHNVPKADVLKAGQELVIDRFGSAKGRFVSPAGESIEARALAPDTDKTASNYHRYQVKGDINVESGTATPWFGEPGGAVQYKLSNSVENLIKEKKLVELN